MRCHDKQSHSTLLVGSATSRVRPGEWWRRGQTRTLRLLRQWLLDLLLFSSIRGRQLEAEPRSLLRHQGERQGVLVTNHPHI